MKIFLIAWGILCFLVIVGLFIVYTTDELPGDPASQQVKLPAPMVEDCSPCTENSARLKKVIQQAERERASKAAKNIERLARLKKVIQQVERERASKAHTHEKGASH